jgi:hypothetical protein
MGFGGGGGSTQTTQYNPTPITPPLQNELIALATDNLRYQQPYNVFGAGYQMANSSPFGQVYAPGPNQTLFGNPYTTTGHEPYFGQSAQAPSNIGFQQGMGGGSGGGQGGGGGSGGGSQGQNWAQNYSAGSKLTGLVNGGGYRPPPVNQLPGGIAQNNQQQQGQTGGNNGTSGG